MPVSEHGAVAPIVVDVAKAIQQMEDNPELAAKLNELAFGPLTVQQLKVRDEIIDELVEALYRLSIECKLEGLESKAGFDCWLSMADKALAKARAQ